jgi:hypothetical protein
VGDLSIRNLSKKTLKEIKMYEFKERKQQV